MSGHARAPTPGAPYPAWNVLPWDSAVPRRPRLPVERGRRPVLEGRRRRGPRDADVKVAHRDAPAATSSSTRATLRAAGRPRSSATHVGAEMDPSHLFWQGIDPVEAVAAPRRRWSSNAAAKDTRINEAATRQRRARRPVRPGRRGRPRRPALGGGYTLSRWPESSSWDFVAVGRGHDVGWWTRFLAALERGRPRHGRQHRARGPGARPARGPAFAAETCSRRPGGPLRPDPPAC